MCCKGTRKKRELKSGIYLEQGTYIHKLIESSFYFFLCRSSQLKLFFLEKDGTKSHCFISFNSLFSIYKIILLLGKNWSEITKKIESLSKFETFFFTLRKKLTWRKWNYPYSFIFYCHISSEFESQNFIFPVNNKDSWYLIKLKSLR